MNNIRNIEAINEQELKAGIYGGLSKGSWHEEYEKSAWVFLGGFPFELSEGDIICVMSQWGEIEDINLVRDKVTNKSKGFAFVKYEDSRSTILAVDNFNGTTLLKRTLRCDHVQEYRLPKDVRERELEALEEDPDARVDIGPGHAYKNAELADEHDVSKGVDLWKKEPAQSKPRERSPSPTGERSKKSKHEKKEKHEKNDKHEKKHKHDKEHKHKHDKSDRDRSDKHRSDSREREREISRESMHTKSMSSVISASAGTASAKGSASNNATFATFQTGAAASWRGNRDPAMAAPGNNSNPAALGNKRPYESGGGGSSSGASKPRTDGISGIGGFHRVR